MELFYSHLGLGNHVTALTESGQPSLMKKDIDAAKIPDGLLKETLTLYYDLQSYTRMLTTYCVGIKERVVKGKIHGEYYQVSREDYDKDGAGGTVTGRLSHRNPNLGNLPRKKGDYLKGTFVKDLFIPAPGHVFLYADFAQIELRVVAELAQDRAFIRSFNAGEDAHEATAKAVGITRQQAKTVNFLIAYGGSAWRLAYELGLDPRIERDLNFCEGVRNAFFTTHRDLAEWIEQTRYEAMSRGHVVTPFGIRRRLPDVKSYDERLRKRALKQAVNFMVQSTAVSLAKRAMMDLHAAGFQLRNQVHDSIICEVPLARAEEKLAEMLDIMLQQGIKAGFKIPMPAEGKILKTFNEDNKYEVKNDDNTSNDRGSEVQVQVSLRHGARDVLQGSPGSPVQPE